MKVKPMTEPQNVKLSGPGLSKSIPASVPTEFTIDASNAGYGSPEVIIQVNFLEICFRESVFVVTQNFSTSMTRIF